MQESCKENSVFSNNSFCVGVLLSLAVCHTLLVPDLHSSDLLSMGVSCGFALFAVCCAHARRASDAGSAFSFRHVSEVCVHQYAMYTIYLRTLLEQKLEMILPRIYKRSILLKSQKMYLQIPDDFECGTTLWGKKCLEKQLIKIRMGRIDFFFLLRQCILESSSTLCPVQLSFPERSGFKSNDGWWVPVASCGVCSEVKCIDRGQEFTAFCLSLRSYSTISQGKIRLDTSHADLVSHYR